MIKRKAVTPNYWIVLLDFVRTTNGRNCRRCARARRFTRCWHLQKSQVFTTFMSGVLRFIPTLATKYPKIWNWKHIVNNITVKTNLRTNRYQILHRNKLQIILSHSYLHKLKKSPELSDPGKFPHFTVGTATVSRCWSVSNWAPPSEGVTS